jgi:hypothetical protein
MVTLVLNVKVMIARKRDAMLEGTEVEEELGREESRRKLQKRQNMKRT